MSVGELNFFLYELLHSNYITNYYTCT